MSNVNLVKTNFTSGELTVDMMGRSDLTAFANGAMKLRNVFINPIGGVSRRPGTRKIATARGLGRLISFEFNTEQVYLLIFTDGKLDVHASDGTWILALDTPWTAAQLPQICWTQTADTLLVVHPQVEPRKITRTGATAWTVVPWTFYEKDGVVFHPHHKFAADEVTLTPSGTSGSVTITASADVFQTAHAGLTLRIKDKQVKITGVTSASVVTADVKDPKNLTDTSATKDWEEQALSPVRGWPTTVCFHQNRLVIGGSRDLPNRLWLSKSSDLFNFDLATGLDDDSIEFAMLSDQVNAIRGVFSGRHLQIFTSGGEWMVTGDPLTPTKIQVLRQTHIGSPVDRYVPPRNVDGATLFANRNGHDLREFLWTDIQQAYQANDLAILARHMVNHPMDQDYDALHRLFHLVLVDGTLSTVTIFRSERVTAWTAHNTQGFFRSLAVVEGEVFLLVERNGQVFVEMFDKNCLVDCATTGTASQPAAQWSGLGYLEGRTVRVLADQVSIYDLTVTSGQITLPEPAGSVQVGLPFTMEIEPLPPVMQGMGAPPGQVARLVRACFRVLDTKALYVDTGKGLTQIPFRRFGKDGFDQPLPSFSGDVRIRAIGWKRDAFTPLWRIAQDVPLPCTLLSVSTEMKLPDN